MSAACALQAQFSNSLLPFYKTTCLTCVDKLAAAWESIELPQQEQAEALHVIADNAIAAWASAVEQAEAKQEALRTRILDCLAEICKLREQLGVEDPDLELSRYQEDALSPKQTLQSLHEKVKCKVDEWQQRKVERQHEYESYQATNMTLKQQLGLPHTMPSRPALTRANIEFLRLEQQRLMMDKERRKLKLYGLLARLSAACSELGEDASSAAAEVHHSLRDLTRFETKLDLSPDLNPDLSDAMFSQFEATLEKLAYLKMERSARAKQQFDVLASLWQVLAVPEDAPERRRFLQIMQGPKRLHTRSIDTCVAEVVRLEGCKAEAMKELVVAKARELQELCAATRIAAPDVQPLLRDMTTRREGSSAGQIAEVLSKLVCMCGEVVMQSDKRRSLVQQINELEAAREESNWLWEYDNDEARYKGRDANRKLQRAIKSGRMRERLPALMEVLTVALQEWHMREGSPFLMLGQDYQAEVLPQIAQELEQATADKQVKGKDKSITRAGQPVRGMAPTGAATAAAAATAATASRGASASRPVMSASKTPNPKSRGEQFLMTPGPYNKRHSIAVPMIAPQLHKSASKSTSRSSEFKRGELSGIARPQPSKISTAATGTPPHATAWSNKPGGGKPGSTPPAGPASSGTSSRQVASGGGSGGCGSSSSSAKQSSLRKEVSAEQVANLLGSVALQPSFAASNRYQSTSNMHTPLIHVTSLAEETEDDVSSPVDGRMKANNGWSSSPSDQPSKYSVLMGLRQESSALALDARSVPDQQQQQQQQKQHGQQGQPSATSLPATVTGASPAKRSRIPRFSLNDA